MMAIQIEISEQINLPNTASGSIFLNPGRYEARPLPNTETSGFWGLNDSHGTFVGNIGIGISQGTAGLS